MVRETMRRRTDMPQAQVSPFIRRNISSTDTPPATPYAHRKQRAWSTVSSSPLQRKGAYSSPGIRLPAAADDPTSYHAEIPERKPTLQDRWEQWPNAVLGYVQGLWMDMGDLIHEPEMSVPLGAVLHVASLVSQLLLPGTSFLYTRDSMERHPRSHLFASHRGLRAKHQEGSYSAYIGQLILKQRTAGFLFMSRLLSLALLVLSVYNAYVLFAKRRAYRLWYREERDVLHNPHASLEAPPTDPPPRRTWQAWAKHAARATARQIPIVEWFVPPPPVRVAPARPVERVYTLRVWDIYEVPLWVFTYVAGNSRLGFIHQHMQFGGPCLARWVCKCGQVGLSHLY